MNQAIVVSVKLLELVKSKDAKEVEFSIEVPYRPVRGDIINLANHYVNVDGEPKLFSAFQNEQNILAAGAIRVLEVVFFPTDGKPPQLIPEVMVLAEQCIDFFQQPEDWKR